MLINVFVLVSGVFSLALMQTIMVYYFSTELDKNYAARLKPFYSCHSAVASSCLRISLGLCLVSLFSII